MKVTLQQTEDKTFRDKEEQDKQVRLIIFTGNLFLGIQNRGSQWGILPR